MPRDVILGELGYVRGDHRRDCDGTRGCFRRIVEPHRAGRVYPDPRSVFDGLQGSARQDHRLDNDRTRASFPCVQCFTPGFVLPRQAADVMFKAIGGSEYCSKPFQQIASNHEILWSMSKLADARDNACTDQFITNPKSRPNTISDRPLLSRTSLTSSSAYYDQLGHHSTGESLSQHSWNYTVPNLASIRRGETRSAQTYVFGVCAVPLTPEGQIN